MGVRVLSIEGVGWAGGSQGALGPRGEREERGWGGAGVGLGLDWEGKRE